MFDKVTTYHDDAFSYLFSQKDPIRDTANALGISATVMRDVVDEVE